MANALDEQIRQLHRQLTEMEAVPASTREQLLILLADMSRLLEPAASSESPAESLETLAARFDAEHPALSDGLRRLIDTLGKAGI